MKKRSGEEGGWGGEGCERGGVLVGARGVVVVTVVVVMLLGEREEGVE